MLIDRQDVFYAIRSARRTPLLTFVTVLALSVGIGLNAGVFAILNFLFLNSPTKKDPASFVVIYPSYQGWYVGQARDSSFNADDYDAIQSQARSLADVAAWQMIATSLDDVRRPGGASILVTCNYFHYAAAHIPQYHPIAAPRTSHPNCRAQRAFLERLLLVRPAHHWKGHPYQPPTADRGRHCLRSLGQHVVREVSGYLTACNLHSVMAAAPSRIPTGRGLRLPGACAPGTRVPMPLRSWKRSSAGGTDLILSRRCLPSTERPPLCSPMDRSFAIRQCNR